MATKTKSTLNGKPKAIESPDILTLVEAAEFLRVPEKALLTDVIAGRIPGRMVGGEWRFSKSTILEWFAKPQGLRPGSKEAVLSVMGIWKDDPTVDDMMKEIERRRGAR